MTRLDAELLLSAEQRQALRQALAKEADALWFPSPESFAFAGAVGTLPSIPEPLVQAVLTPAQRRAWTGYARTSGSVFNGPGIFGNAVATDEDFPADERPPQPLLPALPAPFGD